MSTLIRRRLKRFSAMHWLPNVGSSHKCANQHGHNYVVWVELQGPVGEETGWIVDTALIDSIWKPIHAKLDHQAGGLNAVKGLENPTTELLARWIHKRFREALWNEDVDWVEVRVIESEDSEAVYVG